MIRETDSGQFPIPWRLNTVVLVVQVLCYVGLLVAVARPLHPLVLAGAAVAFGVMLNSIYSSIHEAEHGMLLRGRRLNDAVGVVMALLFPAPFHLIRQGHLGHHLRNRSDDEAFDLYFEGDSVLWRWLVWLHVLTGVFYWVVVSSIPITIVWPRFLARKKGKEDELIPVDRAGRAFLESLNPRYVNWIRLESVAAVLLHGGIVYLLGAWWWHALLCYGVGGFFWSAMQYVHHYETERHVTKGARNLWLWGPIDLVLLNHNWHRAHHEHPTVPWTYLPRLGNKRAKGLRGFLPWHYLRMWRGPKRATERVENKYAGRVIQ